LGDGFALVQDMADVLKKTNTEILVDRIKSPSEAVKTLLYQFTMKLHLIELPGYSPNHREIKLLHS
jgi:hypothetical protein